MDLRISGKFIAEQRKAKGFTQIKLAEILHVSEKTISKWECGNGFPDTTLILPLCEALNISANELLSGKILAREEYREKAEQNLMPNRKEYQICWINRWKVKLIPGRYVGITFFLRTGYGLFTLIFPK